MEKATLRPVPLRPAGPVDPAEALAHVLSALPELDEPAARALALVEIAGRTREEALRDAGFSAPVLAEALYRARKALRRSIFPLSASGWCERAERLLSDRIDGVLVAPGPGRLDVHLRNCERCVDHERRLSQAREKLVRDYIGAHPEAAAGPAERARIAELRVVEPAVVEEAEPELITGPTRVVPGLCGPRLEADAGEELPRPSFAGPGGQAEYVIERRPVTVPDTEGPDAAEGPDAEDPTIEEDIAPAEPGDATPSEHDAETADPLIDPAEEEAETRVSEPEQAAGPAEWTPAQPARHLGASLLWGAMIIVSVGLAVCALILTILAFAGVERVF